MCATFDRQIFYNSDGKRDARITDVLFFSEIYFFFWIRSIEDASYHCLDIFILNYNFSRHWISIFNTLTFQNYLMLPFSAHFWGYYMSSLKSFFIPLFYFLFILNLFFIRFFVTICRVFIIENQNIGGILLPIYGNASKILVGTNMRKTAAIK